MERDFLLGALVGANIIMMLWNLTLIRLNNKLLASWNAPDWEH